MKDGKIYGVPKVEQDAEKPVERAVLAAAIVKISEAAEALRKSGLNRRAISVLLADSTKLSKGTIRRVLDGLDDLRRDYTK